MDKFWNDLIDELSIEPNVYKEGNGFLVITSKKPVPLFHYNPYMNQRASFFIGECRRNIESNGRMPDSFNDLLFKLNLSFRQQFGIDFPQKRISYPIDFGNIAIPQNNIEDDPMISILKSKINAFEMAITFLRETINNKKRIASQSRTRIKANIRDFRTEHKASELYKMFETGKSLGLLSRNTNHRDFTNIFQGKPANGKINWTCTIFSLYKFINGINGNTLNKLTAGKWDVVSRLFLINGKPIKSKSFNSPTKGENDRLVDVEIFTNKINQQD